MKRIMKMIALFYAAELCAQLPANQATLPVADASELWLEMTTQAGHYCQTRAAYTMAATDGLDDGFDKELSYSGPVAFYTTSGTTGLATQAKGAFRDDDVLPLAYRASYPGTFTLSLANKTGIFASGQNVYLRDKLVGTITNLCQQAYFFSTTAGTFESRFDIVYIQNSALTAETDLFAYRDVIVYKDGNNISIDARSGIRDVTIYDIAGRLVYQSDKINNINTTISNLTAQQQVLLLQIATGSGMVSKKIVF